MKQVYHLIIGCALLGGAIFGHTNSLQAQGTKKPIPTIRLGAEWNRLFSFIDAESIGSTNYIIRDLTEKISLYKKETDEKGVEWISDGHALFREDLDKGIIYIRYKSEFLTTPEMVLFDYNLNVGDSINLFDRFGRNAEAAIGRGKYYMRHIKEFRPVIEKIEKRMIGGIERRVYTLSKMLGPIKETCMTAEQAKLSSSDQPIEWIEGLGYNLGFAYELNLTTQNGVAACTLRALCYTSPEGETIHLHPGYKECTIQGVRSIEARPEAIGVKVMRAGDSLILTVEDGATHRLTVYSMEGMQLIPEETFVGSYRLPISRCAEEGQAILLRIDNHSVPYIL